MPYGALQTALDAALPPGGRYYLKGHLMADVGDDAVATVVEHYGLAPSPASMVLFQQLGNAARRVDPAATAFSHRDARYDLVILASWTDPADDEKNVRWARELHDAMEPFSLGGVYVNSIADDDPASVQSAYRAGTFDRLAALKATYDPANFFRLNANIPPAAP